MALSNTDLVTELYVGYFNRAPDPAGLQFWLNSFAAGATFTQIADSFSKSSEATSTYPYLSLPGVLTPDSFVISIYNNILNRAPDAAGQAFWVNLLNTKQLTPGGVISEILKSVNQQVGTPDALTLANKVTAGEYYVTQVATANIQYNQASAHAALAGVTSDSSTVVASQAVTDAFVASGGGGGAIQSLTPSVDNLVGTAGSDIFNGIFSGTAGLTTVTNLDSIDGVGGVDTLNIVDTATAVGVALALPTVFNVKNVEVANLTSSGSFGNTATTTVFDVSGWTGLTNASFVAAGTLGSDIKAAATTNVNLTEATAAASTVWGGAKVAVVNSGAGAVNVTGAGLTSVSVTGGSAAAIENAATVGGTAQSTLTSVTLNSVAGASTVKGSGLTNLTVSGANAAPTSVTVTNATANHTLNLTANGTGYDSTGAAQLTTVTDNVATKIAVTASGAKSNIALASSSATSVTAAGSVAAAIGLAGATVLTSFDGSADTGGLALTGLAAGVTSIKTGSGVDTFAVTATAKVAVDAGAGNDTVTLSSVLAAGSTVTLGAGDDVLLGTSLPAASATTVIDGGTGIDTVAASLINAGNAAQFVNFEHIGVGASGVGGLDVSLVSGITGIDIVAGAATSNLSNVSLSQSLAILGNNTGSTTLAFAGATGSSDSYSITFNASTTGTTALPAAVGAGTVTINAVENVAIHSNSAAGVNANSITLTDSTLQTLSIDGSQALTLTFAGTTGTVSGGTGGVSLINGSSATGALSIDTTGGTFSAATAGLTVNTGSGNDVVTLGQAATVSLGAGTDVVHSAAGGGTFTGGAGNDTFDVKLAVSGTAALSTVTDFTAGDAIQVTATSTTFNATAVNVSAATDFASALALVATTLDNVFYFNFGSNTYIVDNGHTAAAGDNVIVKLVGTVDLSGTHINDTAGLLTLS
jgi:hypothetical protein